MKPVIGITMGDPAGVGPEVIVKALIDPQLNQSFFPLIIGKSAVFEEISTALNIPLKLNTVNNSEKISFKDDSITVLDSYQNDLTFRSGQTNESCGDHSYQAVAVAVQLCNKGIINAMVTAPICKQSWHLSGHKFDGHTGLLAHLTGTTDYRMMFASDPLNVVLVTTHIPLIQVSQRLSVERVYNTIKLGFETLKKMGKDHPRIAVCGLNPHAGEEGLFGNEEIEYIKPAMNLAKQNNMEVSGPFPADTGFLTAIKEKFDLVVAQYHDQGLIPVKLLAFDSAVNLTIGLPIIRTSVDHGTAFDIAGKNMANHRNMIEAIHLAIQLSRKQIDS